MSFTQSKLGWTSRQSYADAALAAFVVLMVGIMILPIPTWLLDLLLASNLSIAVLVLLVALYIPSGLHLAAFPTLLLITTLYRLSLNISSTRLILAQADAGEIIFSFGRFVVQGNYVVGAVVFAILTLIQFVVIVKGSERIAEVGARFSLDALPGKQMAIDADVRSGLCTPLQARSARQALQRETQFYGAMDGAMKFVKGDAIAGLVIVVVNLVGGLAIGVGMRGLDFVQSLKTYGMLSIGDGLVSQIPALLISTAAGLVVTRVASEDQRSSLGTEIVSQVFGQFKPLQVAAFFLFVLALVPGLPMLPFSVLAGLLFLVSLRAKQTQRRAASDILSLPAVSAPIQLEYHATDEATIHSIKETLRSEAQIFLNAWGLPALPFDFAKSSSVEPGHYNLLIHGISIQEGMLVETNALTANLLQSLRAHLALLLGIEETQTLLRQITHTTPALVEQTVPKRLSLPAFASVLKQLLAEGISIRPLREILEAVANTPTVATEPAQVREQIRAALKRHICQSFASQGVLYAYAIDPSMEEIVRESLRKNGANNRIVLSPDLGQDVVNAFEAALRNANEPRVVLTQADIRGALSDFLREILPNLVLLSYAELSPNLRVERLGILKMEKFPI